MIRHEKRKIVCMIDSKGEEGWDITRQITFWKENNCIIKNCFFVWLLSFECNCFMCFYLFIDLYRADCLHQRHSKKLLCERN